MNPVTGLRNFLVPQVPPQPAMQPGEAIGQAIPAQSISELGGLSAVQARSGVEGASGGFGALLSGMVKEVSAKQAEANSTVGAMLAGEEVPLHQAMIAMEEASVSFQLMVEVRNKLMESYQELMRMQI